MFSVQYQAKGEEEFILPFFINNEDEIVVWVDNTLQTKSKYYIKLSNKEFSGISNIRQTIPYFGKIIFYSAVGSINNPKVVSIEKSTTIERKTDFKDFTNFRADNLNIEFDNFINILRSLQYVVYNSIQKSKLENKNTIIIAPKSVKGKGIYWGENGELLNTDQNINDLLNELAESNPNLNNTKIAATKVAVNIQNTIIKKDNAQEFLQLIDVYIEELKNKQIKLIKNVELNNNGLTKVNVKVDDRIIPELTQAQININSIQKDINNIKETLTQVSANGSNLYSVIHAPIDENNKIKYLVKDVDLYRFKIVNISPTNPLILNFAYMGTSVKFVADDISKFYYPHCVMPNGGKGRYYVLAEIKEDKLFLMGTYARPHFSYVKPTKEELILHGCRSEDSNYFKVKDLSFFGARGSFKDKPWLIMYLGYYEVNENGEIASDVTYYTNGKTFDYYLDVKANSSYTIPNLLGCNYINVEIYALYENNLLIPVCNQSKLNKDFPNVLEMGTNYSYNIDQINIDTAPNGVYGYYKGKQLIFAQAAKLKVVVTRKF